ncbi:hypothetical protein ATPR_2691 [Acetobacter tropicalis NBRC 101654]|uniref:Uncharacterized protein n=1 Tax=Acetobacter tropicalis NBRC 101654 TaxID=749388 RepID=F7VH42_9PROT|nr:hypothetical protein [Acetobacter tropicalis]GAA09687.1 hypothetical protein ATPR_2691 [Acetobacter tropicalis NBRC 101654]
MIKPLDIITQIQKYTKVFKSIGLTAELQRIIDQEPTYKPQMPACFVCFKSSTTTENESLNGYLSVEEINISIFVVLDNSQDTTGSTGMCIDWIDCNNDLKSCLMNWVPNEKTTQPISYHGSEFMIMTGSRIIYECTFEVDQQLTEQDGFIQTYDELQEVDINSKYYKDSELEYEVETISNLQN